MPMIPGCEECGTTMTPVYGDPKTGNWRKIGYKCGERRCKSFDKFFKVEEFAKEEKKGSE